MMTASWLLLNAHIMPMLIVTLRSLGCFVTLCLQLHCNQEGNWRMQEPAVARYLTWPIASPLPQDLMTGLGANPGF